MKKFLSFLLTMALLMTLVTGTAFADPGKGKGNGSVKDFKDIKGHWGFQSIKKMETYGVLKGYEDGTFRPDNYLTQAELAVIIERIVDQKLSKLNSDDDEEVVDNDDADDDDDVKDVPAWAKKAIKKGFKNKYFNLKRFHSHVQANRLMACVALAKALELDPVTDYKYNPFKDSGLISEEDYGYLVALYEAGYIKGFPNGNFNPNYLLKRAEMAAIIEKLFGDKDEEKDETAPVWTTNSAITASAIKSDSVELKWTAATDDEGVVGYKVSYELDGTAKVRYVDAAMVTIAGLEADTEYTFTVKAKDKAGNWSKEGLSVKVTTLEAVEEDTEEPSWATDAAITVVTSSATTVALEWDEADDNVGVKVYQVKVYEDGDLLKSSEINVNEAEITGLEADTEYTFKVRAKDEAGNWSSYLSKTYLTDK